MTEIRLLTVRQPWAWAIIHGGKDVENRTRNIAGAYRGPLAIQAAQKVDGDLPWPPVIADAMRGVEFDSCPTDNPFIRGGIIGVVDLVDAHWAGDICGVEVECPDGITTTRARG